MTEFWILIFRLVPLQQPKDKYSYIHFDSYYYMPVCNWKKGVRTENVHLFHIVWLK